MVFKSSFTILSDTRYLGILRQWVEAASAVVGKRRFPHKAVVACSLALVEAVDNAIFHAHGRDRERPIGLTLSVNSGDVEIEVIDCGSGIGEHREVEPDEMVTHGRGLFLIRELMNSVTSRVLNGKHRMRMVYKL